MVGTGRGPLGRTLEAVDAMARGSISPLASADSTPGSLSGVIGQLLGLGGPSATIVATCASGATAIALGAMHLLTDDADAMIVGGADAPIVALMIAQLSAAGVCGHDASPELTCRPYDLERTGLMVGEGAAALVLERESAALRRGAVPLARLTGWATGNDLGGRTGATADGEGLVRVVRRALERSGHAPAEVDHINGHGTGTRLNDSVEARALNAVFGQGRVPPMTSTKPITGHCLGATAAIEAVLAVETLISGCLPPTANHVQLDPEIDLDVVAGSARPASAKVVLSTSLGFWGAQAALILERV
jgi:3-oxoacyl-(acyl-carrier-protein) synthase